MKPTTIAIIGVGKISHDQHLPVIAKSPDFELVGLVSQRGIAEQRRAERSRRPAELYAAMPDMTRWRSARRRIVRHSIAREALAAGKQVMLEKPPTPTVAEIARPRPHTPAPRQRVIFSTWHSQYNAGVDEAKKRLAGRGRSLHIEWKEDVRTLASRPGLDLGRRQFRRVRSRHQRSVDPDQDRSRRDVRALGETRISGEQGYADCGLADLLLQRRRRRRAAHRRIRLAARRRSELEHRRRRSKTAAFAPDPRRLKVFRRRQDAWKPRWPNTRAVCPFRAIAAGRPERHGRRAVPARRGRLYGGAPNHDERLCLVIHGARR